MAGDWRRRNWLAAGALAPWWKAAAGAETPWRLWYRKPAARWIGALPVGNGRPGAMVHGGVGYEILQLNEDSPWAGRA